MEYPRDLPTPRAVSKHDLAQYQALLQSRGLTLFAKKSSDVLVDLYKHEDVDKRKIRAPPKRTDLRHHRL
jgi:hypothetical protein